MHRLTFELLIRILTELTPEDICSIELVSRQWNRCCTEDVWKAYFKNRWGNNKFTPMNLRTKSIKRCEIGRSGGSQEYWTGPSSWKKEVMARYHAIESLKKAETPTISYRIAHERVYDTAVNWKEGILLEASDSTNYEGGGIHHLYDGSFVKRSPGIKSECPICRACAAQSGIVYTRFPEGGLIYRSARQEVYLVHQKDEFQCFWLSPDVAATYPFGITIVGTSGHRVFFFSNLDLVGQTALVNEHDEVQIIAKEIHPLTGDEFLILTNRAIYRVSVGKSEVVFNVRADQLQVAYPFIFIGGETGLQRFNLETKEKTVLTSVPVFKCVYANNIIVAYTIPDRRLTLWPINSGQPIWSMPTPLPSDFKDSVTAMALNAAVLVCGGYEGTSCVIDILTGELIALKKAERLDRAALRGTQSIHLGTECEPQMALVLDNTLAIYDSRDRAGNKSTSRVNTLPEYKAQPKIRRKVTSDLDYDPQEVEDDRPESIVPDTLEEEQLEIALALSLGGS